MKRKFTFYLIMLFCISTYAQQETLFSNVRSIGAFGGPYIEVGSIAGEIGASVGGGGAISLDKFFIGGYGQGTSYPDIMIDNQRWNIRFGHGGLWFGYVTRQLKLTHFYSSFKLGWGRARLTRENNSELDDRSFVLTPEVGVEVNLTDFFKITLAGGYRWVNGISQLPSLNNSDFSSPVGIITFRFGSFDESWTDW